MAAKDLVDKILKENKVAVFSKSYCPYCKMAKASLNETGVKYYLMEMEDRRMLMRERERGGREGGVEREKERNHIMLILSVLVGYLKGSVRLTVTKSLCLTITY